jgi:hydrogenase maturation factor
MNGVELAARYGFPPNRLGYCGKSTFTEALRSNLDGKANHAELESELRKFKAHHAYLSLIARENDLEPFDKKVVEAFWIGNGLLENISQESMRSFILKGLFPKGGKRAEKLAAGLPPGSIPHHSFNSLYINFVTDSVERSVESFDSCCITWGTVLSVSRGSAILLRDSISSKDGKFVINKQETKISLESSGMRFIDKVAKGDILSVHWGMAIEKLTPKRAAALEKYTRIVLFACNL